MAHHTGVGMGYRVKNVPVYTRDHASKATALTFGTGQVTRALSLHFFSSPDPRAFIPSRRLHSSPVSRGFMPLVGQRVDECSATRRPVRLALCRRDAHEHDEIRRVSGGREDATPLGGAVARALVVLEDGKLIRWHGAELDAHHVGEEHLAEG